jgi:hypothetical protein
MAVSAIRANGWEPPEGWASAVEGHQITSEEAVVAFTVDSVPGGEGSVLHSDLQVSLIVVPSGAMASNSLSPLPTKKASLASAFSSNSSRFSASVLVSR